MNYPNEITTKFQDECLNVIKRERLGGYPKIPMESKEKIQMHHFLDLGC